MARTSQEDELNSLLNRLGGSASGGRTPALSDVDVRLLASSLDPKASRSSRSLAFLCLSTFVNAVNQAVPGDAESERTKLVAAAFVPSLEQLFNQSNDVDIDPPTLVPFAAVVSSLFPLQPAAAVGLLTYALGEDSKEGPDDPLAVLLEAAELPSALQTVFAELLAQAAGTKLGRDLIRTRCMEWLTGAVDLPEQQEVGVLAAVALSKMNREEAAQAGGAGVIEDEMGLCDKMVDLVVKSTGTTSTTVLLPALEGLSILSLQPRIKHRLSLDSSFLHALLSLSPVPSAKPGSLPITPRGSMDLNLDPVHETAETGLCFGITTILVNLTSKNPALSGEEQQMAKLRAMAASGKRDGVETATKDDPLASDEAVGERVRLVIQAGAISALRGLIRGESRLVKEGLARLCLNLVEDKADRLAFVRDGGFKVLSTALRDLSIKPAPTSSKTPSDISPSDQSFLAGAQALAKLIISTPPHLLFPPPHLTTCLDALTPMYRLLVHPESKLLQQFEAVMALTNLASIGAPVANKIVEATVVPPRQNDMWRSEGRDDKVKVLNRVEELMLDDNKLVRRASTQLICNLVSCPAGFAEYTGGGGGSSDGKMLSRLKILLIMANIDDLATQLAAGGAMAILTESNHACQLLLKLAEEGQGREGEERTVWARVMGMFDPPDHVEEDGETIPVITTSGPDPGLIHRAAVILFNLITYTATMDDNEMREQLKKAREAGVEERLMGVLGMSMPTEVLQPTVECLKLLKQQGVS